MLIEPGRVGAVSEDGAPDFRLAGAATTGEFHCAQCGYGVAVRRKLPPCPMCGGETWESGASSPYARAARDPAG